LAEDEIYFTEQAAKQIIHSVRRDKRRATNGVQQWRERRITPSGGNDISWALTPDSDSDILITPVLNCMIAKTPVEDEYGSEGYGYADVGGGWEYCAGLFPNTWYPIHAKSKEFICAGAWVLFGTAEGGCDQDGYFDLRMGEAGDLTTVYVRDVHSPFGSIESGSRVVIGFKGGEGEYLAFLSECSG
jgi:hypothetical protein